MTGSTDTTGVSRREVALLRLAAQRITGPLDRAATDVAATVRWMTAMQGQDLPGVLTSVALRARCSRADVEAALDGGHVVRSWPQRGTLHLVAAEDLAWMLELTAARVVAGAGKRRDELGLDEAALERCREVAVRALEGGRELTREELLAAWEAAGIATAEQRGYHLIWTLAHTGTLCFGPVRGGPQRLVLLDEWVPSPRRPAREEALAELALRYFTSHGPARVKDFSWWTKLPAADVKVAVAGARPGLEPLDVDGVEHLMAPGTADLLAACREQARGVFLLPGFDEFLLGYGDRSAALPAEFAQRIVPGNNGVFRPTVVSDGEVVGTWRRAPARRTDGAGGRAVLAEPFEDFTPDVTSAIEARAATLA